ncbi:MAG: DNA/RNA non-specific endonuclease, partial [Lentisphaeria bacterium]|nr:DNA/RNA non-specific endonuclease [Lentisphaeria bacterium]
IWKRIESQVRLWAKREQRLCIVTGPVFGDGSRTMGDTDITVPESFYKVLLDVTPPLKMIAFLVPNRASRRPISSFAVTVDEVESNTGLDFFRNLEDELEAELEHRFAPDEWGGFQESGKRSR